MSSRIISGVQCYPPLASPSSLLKISTYNFSRSKLVRVEIIQKNLLQIVEDYVKGSPMVSLL
jgi:hypothetical protein